MESTLSATFTGIVQKHLATITLELWAIELDSLAVTPGWELLPEAKTKLFYPFFRTNLFSVFSIHQNFPLEGSFK